MSTQRQMYQEKARGCVAAVLLFLMTAGRPAVANDDRSTTETPLSNSSLTTQFSNSSVELPKVLRSHRPCGSEHDTYCSNGGMCMFPQDSDKPSCICKAFYSGRRCMIYADDTGSSTSPQLEKLIGIIIGVLMVIVVLAVLFYCFAYKRCIKSAPLIKSAPSESSV
ncbi:epigen-like [Pholidichthys leucotaenia]